MKPVVFRGCGCALVTPMTQEGKIRYDVFEKLIEYQIKNQTAALLGTVIGRPIKLIF